MSADADEPVFDDDFIRGAAFIEPSARERARAPGRIERVRARRAERRRHRARRRLGRARRREFHEPSHRGAVVQVIAGVLVLLLVSTGLWWWNRPGDPAALPAPPAIVPVPAPTGGVPPADPFAGSPAASYADGEAGLRMPGPRAMNGLSAADLALAYGRVRKLIAAANLDPGTVFGRSPDAFAALLHPGQRRDFRANLDRAGEGNTRGWLTSFAAGTAEQAAETVKVHGTATAGEASERGADGVLVKADHLFVYAVRSPGRPETVIREVVRRVTEVFVHREGGTVRLWVTGTDTSSAPSACDYGDGFVHPLYPGTPGGTPTGKPVDPYDQSGPVRRDQGCEQTVRV
ncbi:hypothetical protein AGRA3207_006103 [Actinomadura graeca]|uniref:Uncharacterized protein n=1 Tax=Actinomadura graeca TaxID=2750812 RepID=A0ABX8R0V7_9ACTN|nr:hypothetical protein [Actinomadura graeca]QXJ24721.1 hypothetical protein AGRA3207_006103 [Actinomadura graeca]